MKTYRQTPAQKPDSDRSREGDSRRDAPKDIWQLPPNPEGEKSTIITDWASI